MSDLSKAFENVATGVGKTATSLREAGIEVDLIGYTVEVVVDPADESPAATVSVTFAGARRSASLNGDDDTGTDRRPATRPAGVS